MGMAACTLMRPSSKPSGAWRQFALGVKSHKRLNHAVLLVVGYLIGGDVLRLLHGHMDECLTVPSGEHGEEQRRSVHYEGGAVSVHARSLWRLETLRVAWSGSHIRWGQAFRLRHVTTGKYLSFMDDKSLLLMDKEKADVKSTAFCYRSSKEKLDLGIKKEMDGMGVPEIKYGDSVCYIQHVDTCLWLTYQSVDAKSVRMGAVQRKAIMHHEGHMDDGLTLSRSQHEESRTARVIRSTVFLFNRFIRGLDALSKKGKSSSIDLPIESVNLSLQDLIGYFQPPDEHLEHEDKQNRLRALKNRQNLFQEEGMINLVLECIDRLHVYSSAAHFADVAGKEAEEAWKSILNSLYELLAALIRGNRKNCAQFSGSLDWLISRLQRLEASSGILEVLHCVLVESPEALNIIKEGHIKSIISLLDKHGRNHKVLDVLCSLCVCHGVAVRSNQHLICDNLLPGRDLLLQTRLVNHVSSMRPNIFLGISEGSAQYRKWYYELIVDHVEAFVTAEATHLRIGWASTDGYSPYPGGGEGWGGNGVGDDLYSYGFDGLHLWSGCIARTVNSPNQHLLRVDDVVSCCLDLSAPSISFRINGQPVQGMFENFNSDGLFFPVASFSAGVNGQAVGRKQAALVAARWQLWLSQACVSDGDKTALLDAPVTPGHTFGPVVDDMLQRSHRARESTKELACVSDGDKTALLDAPVTPGHTFGPVVDDMLQRSHRARESTKELVRLLPQAPTSTVQARTAALAIWAPMAPQIPGSTWNIGIHAPRTPVCSTLANNALSEPSLSAVTQADTTRVRFLLGGRHGEFKFLPPPGYAPCFEALLPREKMRVEPSRVYKQDHNGTRDLLGPTVTLTLAAFTPTPVDTSQVRDDNKRQHPCLVEFCKLPEQERNYNLQMSLETLKCLDTVRDDNKRQHPCLVEFCKLPEQERNYNLQMSLETLKTLLALGCHVGIADEHAEEKVKNLKLPTNYELSGGYKPAPMDLSHLKLTSTQEAMVDKLAENAHNVWARDRIRQGWTYGIQQVGFIPVSSLGVCQVGRMNFGKDVSTLKYFTICGLQEGYEPFAVNMNRDITMWLSKRLPQFIPVPSDHEHIEVTRIDGTTDNSPCLKVTQRSFGSQNSHTDIFFYRLSMPVECAESFTRTAGGSLSSSFFSPKKDLEDFDADSDFEYYYSVRIFPGQDPTNVWVGWVTSDFHQYDQSFELEKIQTVTVTLGDEKGKVHESIKRSNCYMVWAGESTSPGQGRSNNGLEVGCLVDTSAGLLTFTANGKEMSPYYQVEPSTKLFPAVFAQATSPNVFQFELGRIKNVMPLSAGLFKSERKNPTPQCPPRLHVQFLTPVLWSRVPNHFLKVETSRVSERHGWQVQCSEALQFMCLHIPEENRFMLKRTKPDYSTNHSSARLSEDVLADDRDDYEYLMQTSTYYYSVRIFPGQEPTNVWVGWVTSDFHQYDQSFELEKIQTVTVTLGDEKGKVHESIKRSNCYMVWAGESTSPGQGRSNNGLEVGCLVDTSAGLLTFTANGKEMSPYYQCPPRLHVQFLTPVLWSRVPNHFLKVETSRVSERHGWLVQCSEALQFMCLHIPEENRSVDILELTEQEDLLKFHYHTLRLHSAVCALGNNRVAHALCSHLDEAQLLYAIENKYMPGLLRTGYYDLLIDIHLSTYATARLMMNNEYIVPMTEETKSITLFPDEKKKHGLPGIGLSTSLRPRMHFFSPSFVSVSGDYFQYSPEFPLEILKTKTIEMLTEAVQEGSLHVRDPVGGSTEFLFVPLIKLFYTLLIMGVFHNGDLKNILQLIEPSVVCSPLGKSNLVQHFTDY
ncbi:UNVERIFIED_CONTAM: hypothetical protein FKN15_004774 [Acipenser sinensis]